jgi:hypothetical protein
MLHPANLHHLPLSGARSRRVRSAVVHVISLARIDLALIRARQVAALSSSPGRLP